MMDNLLPKRIMSLSKTDLETEALRFRSALEKFLQRHPEINLSTNIFDPTRGKFPLDCCKATAFMFGHYLSSKVGRAELSYAWGQRGQDTHGWLQHNGYIIDLTADQFEDEVPPVVVEKIGESTFHTTFKPHRVCPFDLEAGHKFERYADEVIALMQ